MRKALDVFSGLSLLGVAIWMIVAYSTMGLMAVMLVAYLGAVRRWGL